MEQHIYQIPAILRITVGGDIQNVKDQIDSLLEQNPGFRVDQVIVLPIHREKLEHDFLIILEARDD
jgi:hypothetical protein